MRPEGSLPHSHELSICPYPEPDHSTTYPLIIFPRSTLLLSTYLRLRPASSLFPARFSIHTLYVFLSSFIPGTCPAHITLIISDDEWNLRSTSSFSCLHTPVSASLFSPNTHLSNLFSNSHSLRSFFNVRYQVSHPYRTTSKIIVMYILMFTFLAYQKIKGSGLNGSKNCKNSISS
jgi:hypothetical protein